MALSIGFRVSVSLHLLSKLRGVWLLPRRNSHPLVAPAFLWTRNYLIRPRRQRRWDRQAEDLRGLFVLPFALRLLGDLAVGGAALRLSGHRARRRATSA